jgi:hypothetical protein
MPTAADYLRETSLRMRDGYVDDCVVHATALAELLLADGKAPWIAMIRWTELRGDTRFHGPLIPLRFAGRRSPTWNTHYVCCCDGEAWDPLAGEPIAIASYTSAVFGHELPVAEHLSSEAVTAAAGQSLRSAIAAAALPRS